MKVGILGSGFMGSTHASAYSKLPDIEIVSVSSRHLEKAEALAAKVGARATTDDRSILEDPSIDVVSITLPTHLHPEFAIAALEAGKHVLIEKPLALTADACAPILEAQKRTGRILMVAHVVRFWPEYVMLVDLVHSGKLGKPMAAVATRLSQLPAWADWFTEPELSGGAVLDLSIHDFDALNWLMGTPTTIYARGQQAKPGLWNQINAVVDYRGSHGMVDGSEFMPSGFPFTAAIRVVCENGVVEFSFRAGGVSVEMGGGSQLIAYEPNRLYTPEGISGDAYERQIAYFVNCVLAGKQPEQGTPEQGRLAVRCCNAARQSLESGVVVTI
jgi:predicted dehydrogenase